MIASLTGTLRSKTPTEITVDVNGVGYSLKISLSTFERIGGVGSNVHLYTHLHVREDALQLYGFSTESERAMFRLLLTVTGIGPRTAQGILSGGSVEEIETGIRSGNVGSLTNIPGIGKKTAERIIMELRNKIADLPQKSDGPSSSDTSEKRTQAILALTSLGYPRASAEKALRSALEELHDGPATLEDLVKRSLAHFTRHD